MTDQHLPTLFDAPVEVVEPVLPYGGTSGWSGSDTSLERASRADKSGTTSQRQATVLRLLYEAGLEGLTWVEVGRRTGLHHGAASGVLSALHKVGAISRLTERRENCQVYVRNDCVAHRETASYKPNVSARLLEQVLSEALSDLSRGQVETAKARLAVTLQQFRGE